jgi:hypothetical protein
MQQKTQGRRVENIFARVQQCSSQFAFYTLTLHYHAARAGRGGAGWILYDEYRILSKNCIVVHWPGLVESVGHASWRAHTLNAGMPMGRADGD